MLRSGSSLKLVRTGHQKSIAIHYFLFLQMDDQIHPDGQVITEPTQIARSLAGAERLHAVVALILFQQKRGAEDFRTVFFYSDAAIPRQEVATHDELIEDLPSSLILVGAFFSLRVEE